MKSRNNDNWIWYYTKLKHSHAPTAAPRLTKSFPICPALTLPTVPFITWASIEHSIYTFRGMAPRRIEALYAEYVGHMLDMGFEPQGEWILSSLIRA